MAWTIFVDIILPIFVLIGTGVLLDRFFKLDLPTLAKLNFYVFVPALLFTKTLDVKLSPALFGTVALFTVIHMTITFVLSWSLYRLPVFRRERPVLTLASVLGNAGNYGIPLATLAFGSIGASAMAIVVLVTNFATYTIGLMIMDSGSAHWSEALKGLVKIPVVWATVAALIVVIFKVSVPGPIREPLAYLSDGLIPVALITLGIQLARSRLGARMKTVAFVTIVRLALSPLLALVLVMLWTIAAPGAINQVAPIMVIAAGMPVAVNVYILSVEYKRNDTLASQIIFASTLLSALSLTLWLLIVKSI